MTMYNKTTNNLKLINWRTFNGDNDERATLELPDLIAQSAALVRDTALGSGIVSCKTTYVIGDGLKPFANVDANALQMTPDQARALNTAIKQEWDIFAATTECDVHGQKNFYQLQDILYRTKMIQGNGLALLTNRKHIDSPYSTRIQVLDAALLSNPSLQHHTEKLIGGIEKDDFEQVIRYHFQERHFGTSIIGVKKQSFKWRAIDKYNKHTKLQNITHCFRAEQPGQLRGTPEVASIIYLLKKISEFTDSVVDSSILSAKLFMFVQSSEGDQFTPGKKHDNNQYEVQGSQVTTLAEGESMSFNNPSQPVTQFDQFVTSCLKQIASAVEVPLEILIHYFTSSYSSSKSGFLDYGRIIKRERSHFTTSFCIPVYKRFLYELALSGRVQMPGFFSSQAARIAYSHVSFKGEIFGALNPMQELNEMRALVEMGLDTLENVSVSRDGTSWESKQAQRQRERDIIKAQQPLDENE